MKKIICIVLFGVLTSCQTYYLTVAVEGKIQYANNPVENASVGLLNGFTIKSDSLGYFFLGAEKRSSFRLPSASTIRSFNVPYVTIEKEGFVTDTIDVRDYKYNNSMYVLDTAKVGVIELKME